ncbi:MAG: hypothetical protein RMK29_11040 [Myxococcales bacterium]|nr:hypothetical protein [Myxococcales bacterium]
MRSALPLLLVLAEVAMAAPPVQRIQEMLVRGEGVPLSLQWDMGREGEMRRRLLIEGGMARLWRAPAGGELAELGTTATLTAGQRARLLSGLRSVGLATLRSVGPGDPPADRVLTLTVPGSPPLVFRLPRSQWPSPPGGDATGLAAFLDALADDLERAATARQPVPVPRTAAELANLQLKLQIRPRELPGGTGGIVRGVAPVGPHQGPRSSSPAPRPFQRRLTQEEIARLLQALADADLDRLDETVPPRAAPALGDADGRLVTLHLLPLPDGTQAERQPRGWARFFQDLRRSPAAPLLEELAALLLAPPPVAPPRSLREVVGRDDLVLSWSAGGGRQVTLRMQELAPELREALRQAVIIAAPYLSARGRSGERVLSLSAPVGGRDHLVGTYGGPLAAWRRGHTAQLAHLLESHLERATGQGAL